MPDRELDALLALDGMDHDEPFAIRRPVGSPDILEDFPGRASRERHSRERPVLPAVTEQKRDFAGARDRKDVPRRKTERAGLRAARLRREDLQLAPLPLVTEDDGLAAGSEPRGLNRSAR